MTETEKQLIKVVLEIARAKKTRKAKKREIKVAAASMQNTGAHEAALKTIEDGLDASKATRNLLIRQLLTEEDQSGNSK